MDAKSLPARATPAAAKCAQPTVAGLVARAWTGHAPTTIGVQRDMRFEAIADVGGFGRAPELDVADARRLVACWNACQGIPTETLEARGRAAPDLLEALRSTTAMLQGALLIMTDREARAIAMEQIRESAAAIAKAEWRAA